jgi:hypothetical protein
MDDPTVQQPGAPNYKGQLDAIRMKWNVVLVHSGLHTRKIFAADYPQFGHALSKFSPGLS